MAGYASPVIEFYEGKTVFITGGTGFMGKVLIEKLLMSCPGIKRIIVLIRSKKGEGKIQRLDKLKRGQAFSVLNGLYPGRMDKLQALEGDLELPDLGLSFGDHQLLEEVNVVINMAATINFNEELRKSLAVNVLATKALLEICLSMKDLQSFVHVSTAYANCDLDFTEERIYPAPAELDEVMKSCEQCSSDQEIEELTKRLLAKRPNTYTLTKAMAESVVEKYSSRFPIAIVRPSIVTAALRCPHPGWVDSRAGPTGIIALGGSGLFRIALGDSRAILDIVPVDLADNAIIAVAWKTFLVGIGDPMVYNITSGRGNPIRIGELANSAVLHSKETPLETAIWYPGTRFIRNRSIFNILHFCMHLIPAYLHDIFTPSLKLSLVRMHNNISKASEGYAYFWAKSFDFADYNMPRLIEQMNAQDRATFYCDVKEVQWHMYLGTYVLGVRRYLLGQKDDTIPRAKRRMDMYKNIHHTLRMAATLGAGYYLAMKLKLIYLNYATRRHILR